MGGQDCKAIRCDETGKVTSFLMNDKCAAGTGRALEVMASLLQVRLDDLGRLSLQASNGTVKISSTCVVFAKSEVLALARQGVPTPDILAALCDGVAERVKGLLRGVGVEEEFVISGGISKNVGVVRRVEQKLGTASRICFEPQVVGALGAALFARDFLYKRDSTKD
jgi:benzoyl-CoA reductase subunit A